MNDQVYTYPSIIIDGQGSLASATNEARKIASSLTSFGNIEILEPEKDKKSISIEQARELRKQLILKASKHIYRVVIIMDIGKMGSDAQNTLLKSLEELGDNITLLIPVARLSDALVTIRSRSQIIKLHSNSKNIKVSIQSRKQQLINNAMHEFRYDGQLSEDDLSQAAIFMRQSVSDRITKYKNITENRDDLLKLLHSLRVLCISTMRETKDDIARRAWAQKVLSINDILEKAYANASGKLLLLGAATRL